MTSTAHPPSFDEPPADRSAGPPPLDATPLIDRIFVVDRRPLGGRGPGSDRRRQHRSARRPRDGPHDRGGRLSGPG